jgi:Sec-independent protein translocase protein TatA
MLSFLNNIGPTEIIVIVAVLMLFFGSRVVKMLARSSGESMREIKKIKKTFSEPLEDIEEETKKIKKGD